MFGKRATQITRDDVQRLLAEQWPESADLELKAEFPADGKGERDRWYRDQSSIGDRARNEIVEQAIAMANSGGGTLILGVSETDEKPPRASPPIVPIPKCANAAVRVRDIIRDGCDPRIPAVECFGLVTENDGHSGVVVVTVQESHVGPHRCTYTRRCTIRRADTMQEMDMREIHNAVRLADRGIAALDARFLDQNSRFKTTASYFLEMDMPRHHGVVWRPGFAVCAVLLPLSALYLRRVHNEVSVLPVRADVVPKGQSGWGLTLMQADGQFRPIVRGTRAVSSDGERYGSQELHSSGLVDYRLFRQDIEHPRKATDRSFVLYAGWVMALVANAIATAEKFRSAVNAGEADYAMEVTFIVDGQEVPVADYERPGSWPSRPGLLSVGHFTLPRVEIGARQSLNLALATLERDFWALAQVDRPDEQLLEVDFDRLLAIR